MPFDEITLNSQQKRELEIREDSPFTETAVLEDEEEHVFFDIWEPPIEFNPQPGDSVHVVTAGETGHLDLIAFDYYGNERLWWIIAKVNKLLYPQNEVVPGLQLVIPSKDFVDNYLSKVR